MMAKKQALPDPLPSTAEDLRQLCKLVGIEGAVGPAAALAEHIQTASADKIDGLHKALLAWEDLEHQSWLTTADDTPSIDALAKMLDMNLQAIKEKAQADVREAVAAKTAKADAKADGKAAPAKAEKPARKTKPTQAQAAKSIAQALQAAEEGAEVGPGGIVA
jgi:dGTP triphosphohydrolase